ncbi:hypothetical protein ABI59_10435 [Acidobacteria bacterium Mor1]|nr:hypothetical protein ABI59_10435 [Acidobacteria bacterium Mor1]
MRSDTIKLLHEVAGRPMVAHVLEAARGLKPRRTITVVGHQADRVEQALTGESDAFVLQKEQRGTGHAVMQAAAELGKARRGTVLILNGDLPTLRTATLRRLVNRHQRSGAHMTLMSAVLDDATGYGRIVRDEKGGFQRIVEHKDADAAERQIPEINCGIYCARIDKLLPVLEKLRPDNAQGEYYITDAVHYMLERKGLVEAVCHDDAEEVLGVNNRAELARASVTLYGRHAAALQERGVTLLDASRTWIDPRARVGADTVIYPDVYIEGASKVGKHCVIRPGCRISGSTVGNGCEIKDHSVVLDSKIGNDAAVGPFAHLRPGTDLGAEVKIGNFVEIKKTRMGKGAKASHLSYLGDAEIGSGSNIGAGTITCNYDGVNKHRTELGAGVFIGSDTQLVAPVKLGKGAYVGAGSTVTQDVPAGALAVSRTKQTNIKGWVARKQKRRDKGSK